MGDLHGLPRLVSCPFVWCVGYQQPRLNEAVDDRTSRIIIDQLDPLHTSPRVSCAVAEMHEAQEHLLHYGLEVGRLLDQRLEHLVCSLGDRFIETTDVLVVGIVSQSTRRSVSSTPQQVERMLE